MRLLSPEDRILINGRTGSGKTTGAVWLLSMSNYDEMPWIVLNQKCTKIIDEIPGAKSVPNNFRPKPNKPGIFIYHHIPGMHDVELEDLLFYIWSIGGIGIYIDEAYLIDARSQWLKALYTQGREKQIPMITVSQRPSGISRFAISESEFYMLFHVADKDDRKRVQGYIPLDLERYMGSDIGSPRLLPEYHSIYYDVAQNTAEIILPVPNKSSILENFRMRQGIGRANSEKLLKHRIVLI